MSSSFKDLEASKTYKKKMIASIDIMDHIIQKTKKELEEGSVEDKVIKGLSLYEDCVMVLPNVHRVIREECEPTSLCRPSYSVAYDMLCLLDQSYMDAYSNSEKSDSVLQSRQEQKKRFIKLVEERL
ncbi:MAG: hypothetical protein HFJ12_06705 [Bacilli bacterium]|nr:hypothetical protein [Bacilli bacterium]